MSKAPEPTTRMVYVVEHDVVGPFRKGQVIEKDNVEKAMNCKVKALIDLGAVREESVVEYTQPASIPSTEVVDVNVISTAKPDHSPGR